MTEPLLPDVLRVDDEVSELRPLLTQAFHIVLPNKSLDECAALASDVLRDAEDGDYRGAYAAMLLLKVVSEL